MGACANQFEKNSDCKPKLHQRQDKEIDYISILKKLAVENMWKTKYSQLAKKYEELVVSWNRWAALTLRGRGCLPTNNWEGGSLIDDPAV